ncbi:MAG: tellurite resistance TerB family protein [Pseudomonadota bacterium]
MNTGSISPHSALVYLLVVIAAVDRDLSDIELERMGMMARSLPVFDGYNLSHMPAAAQECAALLQEEGGLDTVLDLAQGALPHSALETAYALCCDMAVADGQLSQEELRMLEILRHRFSIERLVAAAIERGTAVRHRKLD